MSVDLLRTKKPPLMSLLKRILLCTLYNIYLYYVRLVPPRCPRELTTCFLKALKARFAWGWLLCHYSKGIRLIIAVSNPHYRDIEEVTVAGVEHRLQQLTEAAMNNCVTHNIVFLITKKNEQKSFYVPEYFYVTINKNSRF